VLFENRRKYKKKYKDISVIIFYVESDNAKETKFYEFFKVI